MTHVNHAQLTILRLLHAKKDAMTATDLVLRHLDLKISSIYVHLSQLEQAGEVSRDRDQYRITNKGENRISQGKP